MRRTIPLSLALLALAAAVIGSLAGGPGGGGTTTHAAAPAAGKSNLSLWVPEEELTVWDPVNPNVNPVPWRVYGGPARPDGTRPDQFRHAAVGRRVRVEGIAWGYDVKTDLPKSRVLFEGGAALVKGV